jgi:hypothetical protein
MTRKTKKRNGNGGATTNNTTIINPDTTNAHTPNEIDNKINQLYTPTRKTPNDIDDITRVKRPTSR